MSVETLLTLTLTGAAFLTVATVIYLWVLLK
jgi:hypothetical protein